MTFFCVLLWFLAGAAGGNLTGVTFRNIDAGAVGNSVAGLLGGVIGGKAIQHLAANIVEPSDIQLFLANFSAAALGGIVVTIVSGALKNVMATRR